MNLLTEEQLRAQLRGAGANQASIDIMIKDWQERGLIRATTMKEALSEFDRLMGEAYTLAGWHTGHGTGKVASYTERNENAQKVREARQKVISLGLTREKVKAAMYEAFAKTGACIILEDFDCEIGNTNRDQVEAVVDFLFKELT